MNPASLTAAAQQAQAQSNSLLNQDQATAASSGQAYSNYSNQANAATQQAQNEAAYMQGAGSGANQYNTELNTIEQSQGYNPQTMIDANKNFQAAQGALANFNSQISQAGAFGGANGLTGSQLSNYASSANQALGANATLANSSLGNLNTEFANAETGANQATTSQVQTEQGSLTALQNAANAYQTQAAAALQNMQAYSLLAQQQGSLNAQEQQNYAQAIQGYTTAAAAAKQANAAIMTAQATVANTNAQTAGFQVANQAAVNKFPVGTKIDGLVSQGSTPTASQSAANAAATFKTQHPGMMYQETATGQLQAINPATGQVIATQAA